MTHDDIAMQAIYGKGYGSADKSTVSDAEAVASAADPSRRNQSPEANDSAGWFRPSRSVFGAALDQELGIKPGAAGLMPVDEDWHDHLDTEPVVAAVDPLAEIVGVEMSDGWRDTVAAYAGSHADFTTDQVLVDAFGMVAEFVERADQMRVAEILRQLGYDMKQRRVNGERQNLWIKPSEPQPEQE
jgi:hypothetical protein